ncbi:MAG TPA: protein phosphatase CheZ [Acetobacteraceae bacterium]|jgi:chemotaxis protein CheZ|nr:protein phosphatase CheZ [Acetobacteraceae bacterium]
MSEPDLLAQRLAEIRARHPGSEPEMVAEVVRVVLSTLSGDLSAQETSLLAEVEALGHTIARAKTEIAALRVDDITDNHIPFATDELDAIVDHTATATNAILSSCETLDEVARSLTGEPATRLQDATTRIYEACSFQDITGQRINKVVGTLKTIEAKVVQIVATFGKGDRETLDEFAGAAADAALLNGPQHPAVAMDQSDIDKLLASFE